MNKIKLAIGSVIGAVAAVVSVVAAHAQMTTTTLAASIDTMNGTTQDYFTVLLAHYWPFLVGFLVLVAVWHYGKRIIGAFN
jgi:H+/Cl- antiporter ClcA